MTNDSRPPVRLARPEDYPQLPSIEQAADRMFAEIGIVLPPEYVTPEDLAAAAHVLVIGDPIAGFAMLDVLDGEAHLAQIAVHPDRAGNGLGSALLVAAIAWAQAARYPAMTLTTFRDVPWNGPFYARRGFVEIPEADLASGLREVRRHESEAGLDAFGPRIAMRQLL